jgi:hypothetical protein
MLSKRLVPAPGSWPSPSLGWNANCHTKLPRIISKSIEQGGQAMRTTPIHYDELIENRIERCLEKAMIVHCRSGCSRRRAERAVQEATFYSVYRQRLLQEMTHKHIATSQDAVDRFLLEAYSDLPIDH